MSLKCHQKKIKALSWGAEAKKYHQMTTEIPQKIKKEYRQVTNKKNKAIRDEIGIKTGCNRKQLKATKNNPLTYHYLILLNSLFMFCVRQKLL